MAEKTREGVGKEKSLSFILVPVDTITMEIREGLLIELEIRLTYDPAILLEYYVSA